MGEKGKEIVGDLAVSLVATLNQGVAAEALLAYRFLYLSKWAAGIHAPALAADFQAFSEGERAHMAQLMERVIELGGRPVYRLSDWEGTSFVDYHEPPADQTDLRAMVESSLEAERTAVAFYRGLVESTDGKDDVTYWMALEILADEVKEEEYLERLLRKWE
ncbi:MAG: ferritin-like domain-containing protein [Thermoplasmata archaeon]